MSWKKTAKNKNKSMPFQDVCQPFFFIQTLVKDARRPQKRVLRMVIRLFKIMICFNRCCTWEKDQKLIFGSSISVSKKICLYCLCKPRLIYLIILLQGIRNMILVNSKTTCAVLIKRRFGQYTTQYKANKYIFFDTEYLYYSATAQFWSKNKFWETVKWVEPTRYYYYTIALHTHSLMQFSRQKALSSNHTLGESTNCHYYPL